MAGKEFTPAGAVSLSKHQDLTAGKAFPYLGGPYEALDEALQAYRLLEASKQHAQPFVPAGADKLTDRPTRQAAWEMMKRLRDVIMQVRQLASGAKGRALSAAGGNPVACALLAPGMRGCGAGGARRRCERPSAS